MKSPQGREKINEVISLMSADSTSFAKVEKVLSLMHGVDPRLDTKLDLVSRALSTLKNIQEGDVVELAAENLPEGSESEKKKKKAILFFIKSWRELRDEVERVKGEIESVKNQSLDQQASSFAKIATFAKGPFGIITLVAVIAVVGLVILNPSKDGPLKGSDVTAPMAKVKVIDFGGKKIALSELVARKGSDCTDNLGEVEHYHAVNGQYATAVDGTKVNDPGSCAYGKVSEVVVEEITL